MTINTKLLRAALSACSRAADRKVTLPILSCARLEAVAGRLTITASNLDVWVERHVDCGGDLATCAVNLKLIQQAIENVQATECDLKFDGKLVLTDGRSVTRLNSQKPEEFPPWPTGKATPTAVNCADLAVGVDAVAWACAEEAEKREAMENVVVTLSEKSIRCLATSGKAFAHYLKPSIAAPCEFRIPVKFVPALIEALEQPHSLLAVSDSFAECSYEGGKTLCKLSALEFVKGWEQYMDARNGHPTAVLQTETMSRLCSLCLSYHSERRYPQLDLHWSGKAVGVEINGDVATNTQQISAKGKGSGDAYLNAKYLSKALTKMGEEVKFTPAETASFWESGDLTVIVLQLRAPVKT